MLADFIADNRQQILDQARQRAIDRTREHWVEATAEFGIPTLLTQIAQALRRARNTTQTATPARTEIASAAATHGHELQRGGWTIAEVVNDYGDVCQVVTQLAAQSSIEITAEEFHILNQCLDEAVAAAVTAYGRQRERDLVFEGAERLGVLAHEMRNLLNTMTLTFAVIREGKVGLSGSTGAMLARSLSGLCALVDRSVAEVRLDAGTPKIGPISLRDFLEEMQVSAAVHAEAYGLQLIVHPVAQDLLIDADWQLLASAVSNLLQNAFKFSRPQGCVSLVTRLDADRVLIDVCDQCGGLPPGKIQNLFRPFIQESANRSGLGLGLSVALGAVRANAGDIQVRDMPGRGCVFTIDLPRQIARVAAVAV